MTIRLQKILKFSVVSPLIGLAVALTLAGCQSTPEPAKGAAAGEQPKLFGILPPAPEKSGALLWSDNCMRCHNGRPPQEFSDAQWDTLVHHMRLRANLTGVEARKITEFLQASN